MHNLPIVLLAYMITSLVICIIGCVCTVIVARYTANAAKKISRDITHSMSAKIEHDIKRDIDSGKFFY